MQHKYLEFFDIDYVVLDSGMIFSLLRLRMV